jgi:predicted transcriptional regulator
MERKEFNSMTNKKQKKVDIAELKYKIWSSEKKQMDIANKFKVSPAFVSMVIHGKRGSKRIVDYIMNLERGK